MNPPDTQAEPIRLRRTYRYRIYPTRRQAEALTEQLAFCCDLYNAGLQERRDAWSHGVRVSYYDQSAQLTQVRHEGLAPESMNFWAQQESLRRLDRTFQDFFRRCKAGEEKPGYPRFRARARYDSLTWSMSGTSGGVAILGDRLRLQGVGCVKVKWHRAIPAQARLCTVTVTRSGGRWHAGFSLQMAAPVPEPREPSEIGLDLGIAAFATLSNGERILGPAAGRRGSKRVRRHQRTVSRRKRGSKRRRKAVAILRRAHERVRNVRRDHRNKVASDLSGRFTLIAVEDLAIKNMTRSAKGTIEEPGRNVRQKAGLNRSQLDQAWGYFLATLRSKAEEAGSVVVAIDPRRTSQTCHECGTVDGSSRRSQAEFICVACGHQAHADVNAARNILRLGRSRQAITVEGVPRAVA